MSGGFRLMVPGAAANLVVPDFRGAYAGVASGCAGQRERTASHDHLGRAADCVPSLFCVGRDAGDLGVGVAHLGQGIKLVGTSRWLCLVGAEQRERVLDAQLIPQPLELDGGIDQAGIPEQRYPLAEDANRLPSLAACRAGLIACQKPAESGQPATESRCCLARRGEDVADALEGAGRKLSRLGRSGG